MRLDPEIDNLESLRQSFFFVTLPLLLQHCIIDSTCHVKVAHCSFSSTMSGKRVLDAIALLKASRNVAQKHLDIRLAQTAVYTQTSSIFKAVRSQAPAPFAAAAQNFSHAVSRQAESPIPKAGAASAHDAHNVKEGIEQDHFYSRSEDNAAADPAPQQELEIEQKQAQRQPLPDGTIPPAGSPIGTGEGDQESFYTRPTAELAQHPMDRHQDLSVDASSESSIPEPSIQKPLSPQQAREAQRMSEAQIPATSADPPTAAEMEDFRIEQEQDVYYQPPGTSSPVLSALPRMRVPKIENDVQAGDSHIRDDINADVYYSGSKGGEQEQELTEEQLAQIFTSPRVASMLGKAKAKYAPGGVAGRKFHTSARQSQRSSEAEKQELRSLAAEMAKDVEQSQVCSSCPLRG
jgi:aarF domain-containing kinase